MIAWGLLAFIAGWAARSWIVWQELKQDKRVSE